VVAYCAEMIASERRELVTLLRIERHAQRNALDLAHCTDLLAAVEDAATSSRCIVITGEGTTFCAGADLDTVHDKAFRETLTGLLRRLGELPVPVVAAVNGPAIGAGTQLAIACDLRVAAPTARFAVPTARLGLALDPWSVARLTTIAGGGLARALLLGVETVDAGRAHALGLADRLGDLDDALGWAAELAGLAPLTMAYNKLAVAAGTALDPEDPAVNAAMFRCYDSDDAEEGRRARQERRTPIFRGR
jgi:enoyl-CoA hydratase